MKDEPSFFEVDNWVLRGDEEALTKLDGNPEWQAHLREVRRELSVPAWVHELDAPRPRRRPWWWMVGLAAAAAVVVLVAWPRPTYVGVKGDLGLTVYLEQERWDGTPMAVGEPFRLELSGPPRPYFAVVLQETDGAKLLVAGAWPSDGVVPGAWAFDAPPSPEDALIVLALTTDPAGLPVEVLRARAEAVYRKALVPRLNKEDR